MLKCLIFLALFSSSSNSQTGLLSSFFVPHKEELLLNFKHTVEDTFLLLVKEGCHHSDEFLKLLNDVTDILMDLHFYIFYCGWDGFCYETFNSTGYPDFRFYPAKNLTSSYISYPNDQKFKSSIFIKRFIERHLKGIIKSMIFNELNSSVLKQLKKDSIFYEESLVFFCEQDFGDFTNIKDAIRTTKNMVAVSLQKCNSFTKISDYFLQKFVTKRKKAKGKILLLVNYAAKDYSILKGNYTREELFRVINLQTDVLVPALTLQLIYLSIKNQKSLVILFVKNQKSTALKTYRSFVKEWKKTENSNDDKIFSFCDFPAQKGKAKIMGLYTCSHFRSLAGIAKDNIPAMRIFTLSANKKLLKYLYPDSNFKLWSLMEFFQKMKQKPLLPYTKNSLSKTETDLSLSTYLINNFDESTLPSYLPTFIFLYADSILCPVCEEKFNEFSTAVQSLDNEIPNIKEKVHFSIANILRKELDRIVVGQLPIIIFIEQKRMIENDTPAYTYDKDEFNTMVKIVINGEKLSLNKNFIDLNSISSFHNNL